MDKPVNENYAAVVVKVRMLNDLEGLDRVKGSPFLGFQAIVGSDTKVGDLGIVFPAETQLVEEYAYENNLHRHGDLNKDESVKGYLEDTRRVKAIKFRGNRSDCLFMPLSSLAYTGVDLTKLKEGDTFDKLNGHDLCKKYVIKEPKEFIAQAKKERRVEERYFPKHFDTANYWKNVDSIDGFETVVVTQKLHGTSIRIGNVLVKRKLNWKEKLARFFGAEVKEMEYANVYGSRNVVKDPNDPDQDHFYSYDMWTKEGSKLDGVVPKDYIVYGELVGWTENGDPIQRNYTYRIPKGQCELYVYRIVHVNADGLTTDLAWDHIREFCAKNGLKTVPELWRGKFLDFCVDDFMDENYHDLGYSEARPLDPGTVDEGVCVRAEGLTPRVLKAKSPQFLQHETKLLDKGILDLESDA